MSSERKIRRDRIFWFITVGAVSVAVALIAFEYERFRRDMQRYAASPPLLLSLRHPVRLTIDFGGGVRRAFLGEVQPGMTLVSALRAAADVGRMEFTLDKGGAVVAIGGIAAGTGGRWRAYRNGTAVADLPGGIDIRPGDQIILRRE